MSVYVDDMRAPYRRIIMCHMLADTEAELHDMAQRIGIARKWYQANASTPHYDICLSKRAEAVKLGAIEIDRRQCGELIKRLRAERLAAIHQNTEELQHEQGKADHRPEENSA